MQSSVQTPVMPHDVGRHLADVRLRTYEVALRPQRDPSDPSYALAGAQALELAMLASIDAGLLPRGWPTGHLLFRRAAQLAALGLMSASGLPNGTHFLQDGWSAAWILESAVIGRCLGAFSKIQWKLTRLGIGGPATKLAAYNQYWIGVAKEDAALRLKCVSHLRRGCTNSLQADPSFTVTAKRLALALGCLESADGAGLERQLLAILNNHATRASKAMRELPQFPGKKFTEPDMLVCSTALALLVRAWEVGLEVTVEGPYLPEALLLDFTPVLPPVTSSLVPVQKLESARKQGRNEDRS